MTSTRVANAQAKARTVPEQDVQNKALIIINDCVTRAPLWRPPEAHPSSGGSLQCALSGLKHGLYRLGWCGSVG